MFPRVYKQPSYRNIIKQLDSNSWEEQKNTLAAIHIIKNDIPDSERAVIIERVFTFLQPAWPANPDVDNHLTEEELLLRQANFTLEKEYLFAIQDNAMILLYHCRDWLSEAQKNSLADLLIANIYIDTNVKYANVFTDEETNHLFTSSLQTLAKLSDCLPKKKIINLYPTIFLMTETDNVYDFIERMLVNKRLTDSVFHQVPKGAEEIYHALSHEDDLRISAIFTTYASFYKDDPYATHIANALIANVKGRNWLDRYLELSAYPLAGILMPEWYFDEDFFVAYKKITINSILDFNLDNDQIKKFLTVLWGQINTLPETVCAALATLFPRLAPEQQQAVIAGLLNQFEIDKEYIHRFILCMTLNKLGYELSAQHQERCLKPLIACLKSASVKKDNEMISVILSLFLKKSEIPKEWYPQVADAMIALVGYKKETYAISKTTSAYLEEMSEHQCLLLREKLLKTDDVIYHALSVRLLGQRAQELAFAHVQAHYSQVPAEIFNNINRYLR